MTLIIQSKSGFRILLFKSKSTAIKHLAFITVFIGLFAVATNQTEAQINTSAELSGIINSGEQTPFWLQSNRNGIYGTGGSQLMGRFQVHGSEDFTDTVKLFYGGDLITRAGDSSTAFFNQGYLKLQAYNIELAAGRFQHRSPIHNENLSLGSLGVSGNSTPVPQVRLGTVDWVSIPFTQDFIQLRGHFSHGWLGSNRSTDDVLYHEKVGHARFGGSLPINLYGGLAHYAKWGGNNNPRFGDLPANGRDFWRVFFATGGDDSAPPGEEDYMLGDHLGAWDFGFFADIGEIEIKGYRQFPLETKDNLKLKSLQDALTGISITIPESMDFPITEILYEHLYTKWQDGPPRENVVDGVPCSELPPDTCRDEQMGNEDYYNHTIYLTGWTYERRTIGNPLFTPRADNQGVNNNRIVGHHVGISSQFNDIQLTTRATYSRNYGTYRHPFDSPKNQWSFSTGVEAPFSYNGHQFSFLTEAAYDNGSLVGDQFGLLLGLRWMN